MMPCDVMWQPSVLVLQCGADALGVDPLGQLNLTQQSYIHCLQTAIHSRLPLLLLGGGGYNPSYVARCWTALTAVSCGQSLSDSIPEHDSFMEYRPFFSLACPTVSRPDLNDTQYVQQLIQNVQDFFQSKIKYEQRKNPNKKKF
eukprot:TRINITY_DN1913_c0_g1_i1.p1 TRINITY_DN1913_c0_g1~~TRINITY_DN1913_c0_g1_i1.p1  ORF type:complete len:144 (+),score=19.78 TRINITY_DN1913_c0_g1_i1:275-706(+)